MRLNSITFFLTYARCDLPKEEVLAHLVQLLTLHQPTIRVGHEFHQDGGHHLHVFIRLVRKLERANAPRFFDILGHHPNIVCPRRINETIAYVSKGGDFIDHGVVGAGARTTWFDVVESNNHQQFLERVKNCSPRDYVINIDKLLSYSNWAFKPIQAPVPVRPRDDFDTSLFPDMQNWIDQAFDLGVSYFHGLAKASP